MSVMLVADVRIMYGPVIFVVRRGEDLPELDTAE